MRRPTRTVVIAAFVVVALFPLVAMASGDPPRAIENRPLTPRPALTLSSLFHTATYAQLGQYFTDRLPGRQRLVRAREQVSLRVFHESASDQVLLGRKDWRFFLRPVREPCLTAADVAGVRSNLAALDAAVRGAGKRLLVLVPPEKSTVYPQYLQARDLRGSCLEANAHALESAVAASGVTPGFSTVLTAAHKDGPLLYFRQDTHWNHRGALVGTFDLLGALGVSVPPGSYRVLPRAEHHEGDLLHLEGLDGFELADQVVCRCPEPASVYDNASARADPGHVHREVRPTSDPAVAHVFVAADSFGLSLQPLMSPWLGDVTWLSVNGAFAEGDLQAGVRDAGTIIVVLTERDLIDLLPAITQGATRALAP